MNFGYVTVNGVNSNEGRGKFWKIETAAFLWQLNMVESDIQRRSESFAAFSVSGINEKLLLNTKFF